MFESKRRNFSTTEKKTSEENNNINTEITLELKQMHKDLPCDAEHSIWCVCVCVFFSCLVILLGEAVIV